MSHKRKQEDKRRLQKLYEEIGGGYPAPYHDRETGRLIRFTRADFGNVTSYHKRQAAKKVRREPITPDSPAYRGADYRRLYDYLWELD